MFVTENKPGIYLISPNQILNNQFFLKLNQVLSLGLVKIFQLRIKNQSDNYLDQTIKLIKPICKAHNVLFILNDNIELVRANNLDGVHVGIEDPTIQKCRAVLGKNKIIGKSCYNSPRMALIAQKSGADYIAFGSFFQTTTKNNAKKLNIKDILYCRKKINIPVVGIGGINHKNFLKIKRVNLDYIALSYGIWGSNISPVETIKKIKNVIDNC